MRGKETSLERNVKDTVKASGNLSEPKPLRHGSLATPPTLGGADEEGRLWCAKHCGTLATLGGTEASKGQILATREVQTPELSEEKA